MMRSSNDLLSDYIQSLLPPPSQTLVKMEESLRKDQKWGINIGVVEGQLLQFLIRAFRVKKILEIGTQYGYSTQWMLEALPNNGSLVTLEKDPEHFQAAKSFIHDERCHFECGDAKELLKNKHSEMFDLIFIDANKKAYPEYLAWAMEHISPGGLIIGDNTFLFGQVFADAPSTTPALQQAMRTFNQQLMSDQRFHACIIPTAEGLSIAFRK